MATSERGGLHFSRAPLDSDRQIIWQVKRADVRPKTIIILSHEVTGHDVHFYGGASYPCRGKSCEACDKGNRPRWEGWLAGTGPDLSQRWIIGFPPPAGGVVDDYWRSVRTLRGHQFTVWRANARSNARVHCSLRPGVIPADSLPEGPRMIELLQRMWRVREVQVAVDAIVKPAIHQPTGTNDGTID